MEICITSHRYAPLSGGYENQIRALAENLSEHFSVKVVTFNLASGPNAESINNVQVYRVKPQLVFFRVPFSTGYVRKMAGLDFDVLHAHGFVPVIVDLSLFYAKLKGKKTVYTHHFDGNVQDAATLNGVANFYNTTIAKIGVRFADIAIATTKSYAASSPILRQLREVQIIPCFVDCDLFKPVCKEKTDELRVRLNLGGDKTVLFVGRIVPYKGVEYLIEAIDYAKSALGEDFNLLLVGSQEGKRITDQSRYFQRILQLAEKSSVRKNIRFVGRVPNGELSTYYSLADVVALPSVMRGEAFGTVLLESLACGTPVVASNIAGVKDVLKGNEKVGCYFHPKDFVALAHALVKEAAEKKRVTYDCRDFVIKNYHLTEIIAKYVALYKSLIK